jgi:hypothetical protein
VSTSANPVAREDDRRWLAGEGPGLAREPGLVAADPRARPFREPPEVRSCLHGLPGRPDRYSAGTAG